MPTVIGELGGLELYPWAFASYLLAATVTGPVFGKLSDTYGRKPVYLAGIFLFLLGSVLAGTSQSMAALIFFRTIQGLGAGAVQPVAITIVGDIFELEERARIQGLFGAVWGISAVVGPAAGGFITDLISWRWVFYVNVPFGIIAAVLLAATLTESFERRERSMDYLGTALLTGGLIAVLLALLGGGGAGELSVTTLTLFFGGLAVLALFVLVERRAEAPVVPLDLSCSASRSTCRSLYKAPSAGLRSRPAPPWPQSPSGGPWDLSSAGGCSCSRGTARRSCSARP
jgi:multidrug resistance protein